MGRFNLLVVGAVVGLATLSSAFAQSQPAATPTSVSADQDRAFKNDLLEDAAGRASLLSGGGPTSGHDASGFFIGDGGDNRLNINGDFQWRYTANLHKYSSTDNYTGGFNVPLARLRFTGKTNGFGFTVEGGFTSSDGGFTLYDAFVNREIADHAQVQLGQFKLPFLREYNVSDRYQLAVDRSVVSYIFQQGRSQGIQLTDDIGNLRLTAAFSDGLGTKNTDFTNPKEQDYAFTGRADYLISGDRSVLNDFTSEVGSGTSTLVGVSGHYEDGDLHRLYAYTADFSLESGRFNTFVSGVGRNIESGGTSFNDYGAVGQAGFRITDKVEVFGRYDIVAPDSGRGLGRDSYSFATAGFNYYIAGQAAKFTLDGVYSLNETTGLSSMGDFSNSGLLGSSDKGELTIRAQFQLLF